MTERTTIRLPDRLLRQAKRKAASEGRTLTSLIEEALRQVVGRRREGNAIKRVRPRVSEATGGLMPGIDPTRLSKVEELDDLDYLARTRRRE